MATCIKSFAGSALQAITPGLADEMPGRVDPADPSLRP
jgi:hypothetical protein